MTKQEIATYYAKKFTPDNISGGEIVALKAMDAFSERPISEQSYWYETIVPTNDCKVLLETNSKHEPYVVAGWSTHDKCFYDSNEQKYTKWKRWKRI